MGPVLVPRRVLADELEPVSGLVEVEFFLVLAVGDAVVGWRRRWNRNQVASVVTGHLLETVIPVVIVLGFHFWCSTSIRGCVISPSSITIVLFCLSSFK